MTREEKINILKSRKEEAEIDGYFGFATALDSAIKALEQEPILDKIRAEIKSMSGDIETIADVLQIIDKYKAEKE